MNKFNLPKTVKHLEPQVPRCDTRSVGLVQSFQREVPDDHLLPHEQKIQYPPWINNLPGGVLT